MIFGGIVDATRSWFVARGLSRVDVIAGRESRNEQPNYVTGTSNRVAFTVPKDPIEIIAPTHIGEGDDGRRQLWNTFFVFEVAFAGFDDTRPNDEFAHRAQCYELWQTTAQAIQRIADGVHTWTSARWSEDRKHGVHGAELIATLVLNIPLSDVESATATPRPVPGDPKPVP